MLTEALNMLVYTTNANTDYEALNALKATHVVQNWTSAQQNPTKERKVNDNKIKGYGRNYRIYFVCQSILRICVLVDKTAY